MQAFAHRTTRYLPAATETRASSLTPSGLRAALMPSDLRVLSSVDLVVDLSIGRVG
jgi:hypothetical protein